jgi:hypothetical protein
MRSHYIVLVSLLMAAMAISGCTSPAASPSPTAAPTATPTATPAPTETPTPAPTVTPTPEPTAVPEYSDGSPVSVSGIKIDWDTTQFEGRAKETATMTVKNALDEGVVLDVVVLYKVATPAMLVNPDGSVENYTNTVTSTQNIGLMQVGEQRDLTFQVDHTKNVPVTVSVTVQWRGGSAVVFNRTLELPDNSFGTLEF